MNEPVERGDYVRILKENYRLRTQIKPGTMAKVIEKTDLAIIRIDSPGYVRTDDLGFYTYEKITCKLLKLVDPIR